MPISNQDVVIEAIRRCRYRETRRDGTVAEGCHPSSVHHMLRGWINSDEKLKIFAELLGEGLISMEFHWYKREVRPGQRRALSNIHGLVHSFPNGLTKHYNLSRFVTSTKGRLLKRSRGRIKIGKLKFYEEFSCFGLYVTADGIPEKVPRDSVSLW